jgi:hypothetical protein
MAALPDFDALAVTGRMMFEKAKSFSVRYDASSRGFIAENGDDQSVAPLVRRAGEALRAMEWSELTARLNAARDLRMLLRTQSHAPIESAAASFGDAAASYFALLEDDEPDFNPDALGQSKGPGAKVANSDANRPGNTQEPRSDVPRGVARDTK